MSEAAAASNGTTTPSQASDGNTAPNVEGGNSPPKTAAPLAHDDDPEFEFEGFGKLKRSEVAKRLKGQGELQRESTKRFQDGARAKQEAEAILAELDADPRKVMSKRGQDAVKWAEKILTEELKLAQMSPGERRAIELEDENKRLKSERETADAEKLTQAEAQNVARLEQHFDKVLTPAIEQAGLPKTARTVARAAELLSAHMENGSEVTPDEFAAQLREELEGDAGHVIRGVKDDQLVAYIDKLDPRVSKAYRAHFLKNVRPDQDDKPQQTSQPSRKTGANKVMSRAEFHARLDERM